MYDRKFRGEILKIEGRNLEDFHPKFAVKPRAILKPLIISVLQNRLNFVNFVKIFHKNPWLFLRRFQGVFHPLPYPQKRLREVSRRDASAPKS